jgi:hypothetical protein
MKKPVTEQDWIEWERAQKGLPPLTPEPMPEESKAHAIERRRKDAARNRQARTRNPNKRMKQPARKLAAVVDLNAAAAQTITTQPQTPANSRPEPKAMGNNEIKWAEQCKPYAEDNPAIVATICTLATVLDDPDQSSLWPTTTRQIGAFYLQLTGGGKRKVKSRGRLVAISSMTAKTRAAR